MTTFSIPEGKVVDRIELKECDGQTTLNIVYKEAAPKQKKHIAVLCETNEPTQIYLSLLNGGLFVANIPNVGTPDPRYYVPMAQAQPGEFVVISQEAYKESLRELIAIEELLRNVLEGNLTVEAGLEHVARTVIRVRGLRYFLEERGK